MLGLQECFTRGCGNQCWAELMTRKVQVQIWVQISVARTKSFGCALRGAGRDCVTTTIKLGGDVSG